MAKWRASRCDNLSVRRDDAGSIAVVDLSGKKKTLSTGWDSLGIGVVSERNRNLVFQHPTRVRTLPFRGKPGGQGAASGTGGRHTDPPGCSQGRARADYSRCAPRWNGRYDRWQYYYKERDLSWLDWSAPKDLSRDGKKLLFTESGEAGGENFPLICAAPIGRLLFASATD